jgi:RimJ/RimL family protein N-acetyltransferase
VDQWWSLLLSGVVPVVAVIVNTGSQGVLLRNGFRPYGVAPSYLKIAGRWQDHILFHLLGED